MKIYYNCRCCNKRNNIAELLMEPAWHVGDFQVLDTFLANLQANIKNKFPWLLYLKTENCLNDFDLLAIFYHISY